MNGFRFITYRKAENDKADASGWYGMSTKLQKCQPHVSALLTPTCLLLNRDFSRFSSKSTQSTRVVVPMTAIRTAADWVRSRSWYNKV